MDTMAGARGVLGLEAAKAGVVQKRLSRPWAETQQQKWGPSRRWVVGGRSLPPVGRCGSWVSTLSTNRNRCRESPGRLGAAGPLATPM